jgi:hypothetical protein
MINDCLDVSVVVNSTAISSCVGADVDDVSVSVVSLPSVDGTYRMRRHCHMGIRRLPRVNTIRIN